MNAPTAVEPLDTPPDWFASIARRQAEWEQLGAEAALRLWHGRKEASAHVLAAMGVSVTAAPQAGSKPGTGAINPVAVESEPAMGASVPGPHFTRFTTQGRCCDATVRTTQRGREA